MKRILIACGTGICTSTTARNKLAKALDEKGWAGKYVMDQCKVTEVPAKSANFDVAVVTTGVPGNPECPVIMGAPSLLTGIGMDPVVQKVIEILEQ